MHDRGVLSFPWFFLACYLTYHTYLAVVLHQGPTRFENPLWFRPIYLTILISHSILAAVIVPMILVTLYRAKKERFEAAQKNRALDVADVDVCFRDRRRGLLAALRQIPAAMTLYERPTPASPFTQASFLKTSGVICWNPSARGG